MFGRKEKKNNVLSVMDGTVKTLKSLNDGVFSEKMLGDGVVVSVKKGIKEFTVVSPVSGIVVTAFPTGHAYGIRTKSGVEILVHIGVETVSLDGEGFTMQIKQGDKIKAGDDLVKVNAKLIAKKVPSIDPIVLVTSGEKIDNITTGLVKIGDQLFTI